MRRISFLISFIFLSSISQNLSAQTADSLREIKLKAFSFAKSGNRDSVKYYSEGSLAKAHELADYQLISDFNYLMGVAYQLKDRGIALDYYRESLRLADSIEYHPVRAKSAINIGGILRILGQHDSAMHYFKLSKKIFDEFDLTDERILAKYYANLAKYHESQADFSLASKDFLNALEVAERNNFPEMALHYEYGLAKIHVRIKDYDKTEKYLDSAISKARKTGNKEMEFSCILLGGIAAAQQHLFDSTLNTFYTVEKYYQVDDSMQLSKLYIMFSSVYQELGQNDSSGYYLRKSNQLTRSRDYITKANWHLFYSDLKLAFNETDSAIYYANKGLEYADMLKNKSMQAEIMSALALLYLKTGTYDSVDVFYNKSFDLYKESLNESKLAAIKEMNIKYDTEKKEREIVYLKSENKIQSLKNSRQTLIWIIAVSSILFLIAIIVLMYQKRHIRQDRKIAVHKQQLLRSQINPHFIFNALTSIRGFLYDGNDIRQSVNYLGKFARLMRMVLDHSSKEWVPLREELDALSLYLEIQKMRFHDSFDYNLIIDEHMDVNQLMIPPLLAQPFIENAVEHGFKNIKYTGKLDLICKMEGEEIRFSIVDNGIGIDYIKEDRKHESRAHRIFKERMGILSKIRKTKLFYLIEDLSKYSGKRGTKVEFTVPIEWNYV